MFPAGDLSRMQAAQNAHMPDTCRRYTYSETRDDYNSVKPVWTEVAVDIVCGLEQVIKTQVSEDVGQDYTLTKYDAVIRLPMAQAGVFDVRDKIVVTKRFGTTLSTSLVYGIIAPEQRGPSGIRFMLQKTEL